MTFLKQWRFWLSLLLVGFCFYFIQPNFNSKNSDFKINFGLDIQGGFSYLLELNENEFRENLERCIKRLLLNKNELHIMANNVKSLFPFDSSDIILKNIPELHEKLHNTSS